MQLSGFVLGLVIFMRVPSNITALLLTLLIFLQVKGQPVILSRVKCKADTTQTYSLLLPPAFEPDKTYPLVIFLDPGGQGDYAVNRYKEIGDRYHIIFAGSFNSRNFEPGASEISFLAIYNDIVKQYNIDAGRIWVSGFSGGARIAAALAMQYPEISGVIGCGSGFVDDNGDFSKLKAYAAIVGKVDMNYGELMDNCDMLDGMKVGNILLHFEGGHEWPPVNTIEKAIMWLMEKAGEKVIASTNVDSLEWNQIQQQIDSGFLYMSWIECRQLEKISIYREKAKLLLELIEKQRDFRADKRSFEKAREEETNLMNEFSIPFSQLLFLPASVKIDRNIWDQYFQKVQRLQSSNNRYEQLAGVRCADHGRRSCSENYFQLMSVKNYAKAFELAMILSFVDPAGPRAPFLAARAAAGLGNKKNCEGFLREAVKKGLVGGRRVEEDLLLLQVLTVPEIRNHFDR